MANCGGIYYFRVKLQFSTKPEYKLLVYLCTTEQNPLFFKINSTSYKPQNEIILFPSDYRALTRQSHLDCGYLIKNVIDRADFDNVILNNTDCYRGQLRVQDLIEAQKIVKQVGTISPKMKNLIISSLEVTIIDQSPF